MVSEGGYIALLVCSYALQVYLFVLGKYYRLGNNPFAGFNHKDNISADYSKRQIVTAFADVSMFVKSYLTLFVLLPAVTIILVVNAHSDGADDVFFVSFNTSADADAEGGMSRTGHGFIWAGVYFFAISALTWTFSSLQTLFTYLTWDKAFEMLPIQYDRRVRIQTKFFGSVLFSLGTFILWSDAEDDDFELKGIDNLVVVAILAPYLLMLDINYVGFSNLFDGFYISSLPGFKIFWFAMEFVIGGIMISNISTQNETAGALILYSYIVMCALPCGVWMGGSRRITLLGDEHKRVSACHKISATNYSDTDPSPRELVTSQMTIRNRLTIGRRHWLFSPCNLWWPISAYVVEERRERSNDSKLLYVSPKLEPTFFLSTIEGVNIIMKPLFAPIVLPFIVLALIWHYLLMTIGTFESRLVFGKKKDMKSIILTPGVGRGVYPAHGEYEKMIYFVDSPGIPTALGFFRDACFYAREGKQKYFFVFECQSSYDYFLLVKKLQEEFQEHIEFPALLENVEFVILLNGSCARVENLFSSIGKKDDNFKENILRNTIATSKVKALRTNLKNIVGDILPHNLYFLSIGSSELCLGTRRLTAKYGLKKAKMVDVVVEDSMFRMPTQTEAYER